MYRISVVIWVIWLGLSSAFTIIPSRQRMHAGSSRLFMKGRQDASHAALSTQSSASKSPKRDRTALIADIVEHLISRLEDDDPESLLPFQSLLDLKGEDEDLASGPLSDHAELLNGVVRVYCTHSPPNFSMPWQRLKQEFSTSTGFIIDGNKILTNAHAVEYGSLIQVKKRQSEDKYVASVIAVGHECDLAILSIEDPSFWEGTVPLKFGEIPDLLEDVSVVGYPVGGDSVSISSGVVSRIEMQEYAQASAQLLAIQIDAAINPGNSGGPVVNSDNEVIGVAFQSLSEEDIENIGYVVPVNVIHHFLDDVARHGAYSGVCGLGVRMQSMENEVLRKHFLMGPQETGVLVLSTAPLAPANNILKKGDVVLMVDGIKVANDGTIPFREGGFKERVQLNYYFTQRFAGDVVTLSVLRNGKHLELEVPLFIPQQLVPRTLTHKNYINAATNSGTGSGGSIVGGLPSYLMIGGLVMMALSKEYLEAEFNPEHMGNFEGWAEDFRLLALADKYSSEADEEVVLLSQVISHTCNIGYETYRNMQLKCFNNTPVKNLRHLKELVDKVAIDVATNMATTGSEDALQSPLVFEFSTGQLVVLEAAAAFAAQETIKTEHMIPNYASLDLQ